MLDRNRLRVHRESATMASMETLLGLAVLVLIIWAISRSLKSKKKVPRRTGAETRRPRVEPKVAHPDSQMRSEIDEAVHRDYSRPTAPPALRRVPPKTSGDHFAARPAGGAAEAWSPRATQLEVAGEWYRRQIRMSPIGGGMTHPIGPRRSAVLLGARRRPAVHAGPSRPPRAALVAAVRGRLIPDDRRGSLSGFSARMGPSPRPILRPSRSCLVLPPGRSGVECPVRATS